VYGRGADINIRTERVSQLSLLSCLDAYTITSSKKPNGKSVTVHRKRNHLLHVLTAAVLLLCLRA
jgi:hypothetical protein